MHWVKGYHEDWSSSKVLRRRLRGNMIGRGQAEKFYQDFGRISACKQPHTVCISSSTKEGVDGVEQMFQWHWSPDFAQNTGQNEELQADLKKAQKEITKLKQTVKDLKKGKDHLIPVTEHETLLKEALHRAHKAEMKALAFESELHRKCGFYQSTPILRGALSEPEDEAPDIPRQIRIRTHRIHGKNSPGLSPRFHRRTSVGKRSDYNANLRRMSNSSVASKHSSLGVRRESVKRRLEATLSRGGRRRKKESKHQHKNLLLRMHSKLRGNAHKSKTSKTHATKAKAVRVKSDSSQADFPKGIRRQSLLTRVHTRFFSRRKKLRSIYDLPDLSLLQDCNFTKEYEIPRECFNRFEKTPLIDTEFSSQGSKPAAQVVAEDESDEESGWSTSEEEETGSTQKQTRRTKGKSDKKPCKKKKSSKKCGNEELLNSSQILCIYIEALFNSHIMEKGHEMFNNYQITLPLKISGQKPLKSYKRVPGPQGRRKPIRYSHLKSAELSENGAM
ncbi:hypothetical protein HOLleu_25111 [Holothuria leucospilota]|uniref:Uncharacterized protein n=1 Tax=Holothuria leucospilota TaxID=206669 RepID=A0A9Q1H3S2_HOLLE|nr:hypothetical protein HOLleu_25111 [Holothuria leucospilota]